MLDHEPNTQILKGVGKMSDKVIDALRESIITQAIITVAVVGVWLFLIATGQQIPAELSGILTLVIGFYFGSKVGYRQGTEHTARHTARRVNDLTIFEYDSLLAEIESRKKGGE